jgi:hypothetical protein
MTQSCRNQRRDEELTRPPLGDLPLSHPPPLARLRQPPPPRITQYRRHHSTNAEGEPAATWAGRGLWSWRRAVPVTCFTKQIRHARRGGDSIEPTSSVRMSFSWCARQDPARQSTDSIPRISRCDGTVIPQLGFGTLRAQPDRESTPADVASAARDVGRGPLTLRREVPPAKLGPVSSEEVLSSTESLHAVLTSSGTLPGDGEPVAAAVQRLGLRLNRAVTVKPA